MTLKVLENTMRKRMLSFVLANNVKIVLSLVKHCIYPHNIKTGTIVSILIYKSRIKINSPYTM